MSDRQRRPSVPYHLCFAAAVIGIVLLTIAIDGARRAAGGGEAMDAVDSSGVIAFILVWAMLYYQRLAFATFVPPARQDAVSLSLRVVLSLEAGVAVIGTWYVFSIEAASSVRPFILVADLLQVGAVLWLVRYSREGLSGGAA